MRNILSPDACPNIHRCAYKSGQNDEKGWIEHFTAIVVDGSGTCTQMHIETHFRSGATDNITALMFMLVPNKMG